jgi:hypothetical protein
MVHKTTYPPPAGVEGRHMEGEQNNRQPSHISNPAAKQRKEVQA